MCICKVQIVSHCVESLLWLVQKKKHFARNPKCSQNATFTTSKQYRWSLCSAILVFSSLSLVRSVQSAALSLSLLLASRSLCMHAFSLYPLHSLCLACHATPRHDLAWLGSGCHNSVHLLNYLLVIVVHVQAKRIYAMLSHIY